MPKADQFAVSAERKQSREDLRKALEMASNALTTVRAQTQALYQALCAENQALRQNATVILGACERVAEILAAARLGSRAQAIVRATEVLRPILPVGLVSAGLTGGAAGVATKIPAATPPDAGPAKEGQDAHP